MESIKLTLTVMADESASEVSRIQQQMKDSQESYLRGQLEESQSQLLRAQEQVVELNAELHKIQEEAVEKMRTASAAVPSRVGGRDPGPCLFYMGSHQCPLADIIDDPSWHEHPHPRAVICHISSI